MGFALHVSSSHTLVCLLLVKVLRTHQLTHLPTHDHSFTHSLTHPPTHSSLYSIIQLIFTKMWKKTLLPFRDSREHVRSCVGDDVILLCIVTVNDNMKCTYYIINCLKAVYHIIHYYYLCRHKHNYYVL